MKIKVLVKKLFLLCALNFAIYGCSHKNSITKVTNEQSVTSSNNCKIRYTPLNENEGGLYKIIMTAKDEETPLGGSYEKGVNLFKMSKGKDDATAVFYAIGPSYLLRTSTAIIPGFEDLEISMRILKSKPNKFVKIPASNDVVSKEKETYLKAAINYATDFNTQIFKLTNDCHLGN